MNEKKYGIYIKENEEEIEIFETWYLNEKRFNCIYKPLGFNRIIPKSVDIITYTKHEFFKYLEKSKKQCEQILNLTKLTLKPKYEFYYFEEINEILKKSKDNKISFNETTNSYLLDFKFLGEVLYLNLNINQLNLINTNDILKKIKEIAENNLNLINEILNYK